MVAEDNQTNTFEPTHTSTFTSFVFVCVYIDTHTLAKEYIKSGWIDKEQRSMGNAL